MLLSLSDCLSGFIMPLELLIVNWEDDAWYGIGAGLLVALLAWKSLGCSHPTPLGPLRLPFVGYNKQLIKEGQKFGEDCMELKLPGRILVTTIPFLQYLPSWAPRNGWKRIIEALGQACNKVLSKAYGEPKDLVSGRMSLRASEPYSVVERGSPGRL